MITFTRLDAIRKHLRIPRKAKPAAARKRVQKNLSLPEAEAKRINALARRDRISQARLLSAALDAYEKQGVGTRQHNPSP